MKRLDQTLDRFDRSATTRSDGQFLVAIARKARDVRAAQKKYFLHRDKTNLINSKRLEKELDELLDAEIEASSLFDGGEPDCP